MPRRIHWNLGNSMGRILAQSFDTDGVSPVCATNPIAVQSRFRIWGKICSFLDIFIISLLNSFLNVIICFFWGFLSDTEVGVPKARKKLIGRRHCNSSPTLTLLTQASEANSLILIHGLQSILEKDDSFKETLEKKPIPPFWKSLLAISSNVSSCKDIETNPFKPPTMPYLSVLETLQDWMAPAVL